MPKARTLLVGLDACDPGVVQDLVGQGHLPTLGRLLATATRSTVEHEPGYFVGSTWPTLVTGVPVTEHLWYTGTRFLPEHYSYELEHLTHVPLWEACAPAGPVASFDVPHFRVPDELDGVVVNEWGCHDRFYGTASYPPGLVAELDAEFGTHPVGTWSGHPDPRNAPCDHVHRTGPTRTPEELHALFDDLLVGLDRKADATLSLLDRGGWGLFTVVFGESHCTGHQFWHLHDPTHERHDAALAATFGTHGDPLLEVYARLDAALGRLLERVDDTTAVFVLLSHGMGTHHDGTHLLPTVLDRLQRAYEGRPVPGRGARTARLDGALDRLPAAVRRRLLRGALPGVAGRLAGNGTDGTELPPLGERRWFLLDNNTVTGAVRMNLVGREARGVVARDELDAQLDWLGAALLELVNLDAGTPVVESVERSDRALGHGPDHLLGDLLVEWVRDHPIDRVWSPRIGLVEQPYTSNRTGDHRRTGLLLSVVPGVPRAAGTVALDRLDFAPTVAASLGVDFAPRGRPSTRLLGEGYRRSWAEIAS